MQIVQEDFWVKSEVIRIPNMLTIVVSFIQITGSSSIFNGLAPVTPIVEWRSMSFGRRHPHHQLVTNLKLNRAIRHFHLRCLDLVPLRRWGIFIVALHHRIRSQRYLPRCPTRERISRRIIYFEVFQMTLVFHQSFLTPHKVCENHDLR
jgi:hypothetical protein